MENINSAPETSSGTQIQRETAIKCMIEVGYLDFEAELVAQLVHYVNCVPGLVRMGSPHRDSLLKPIADLQGAISSIVTSRKLQELIMSTMPKPNDQDQE